MLKSWAKQDLSDWMVTIAGRDFELPLPPPDLEGSPGPSALIRVRITDTGFWPASLARFHDFKPGNEGVEERVIWQGIPMIRLTLEDKNRQRAILCVADRFLVLVDTTYLKKKEVEDFLKSIPLADLARISTAGNKTLPQPVVLSEIDEINPKKNRSFRLFKTEVPEEASPQQN